MPGTRCTVAVCKNSLTVTKKDPLRNHIKYFNFPKDVELRNKWVVKCQRGGIWNPDSCRVCSIHFTPEDFKRDLCAELLGNSPKIELKYDVVPSINLGGEKHVEASARMKRQVCQTRRCQRRLANELIHQESSNTFQKDDNEIPVASQDPPKENYQEKFQNAFAEIGNLKSRVKKLKAENQVTFSKYQTALWQNEMKNTKIRILRKQLQLEKRKVLARAKNEKMAQCLFRVFSDGQRKLLLGEKKENQMGQQDNHQCICSPLLEQKGIHLCERYNEISIAWHIYAIQKWVQNL